MLCITLAYTKNAPKTYEIVDHAGAAAAGNIGLGQLIGDALVQHIRAAGKKGSGLNHVVIKTVNGDVILRQE